jgi:hypothetical protein
MSYFRNTCKLNYSADNISWSLIHSPSNCPPAFQADLIDENVNKVRVPKLVDLLLLTLIACHSMPSRTLTLRTQSPASIEQLSMVEPYVSLLDLVAARSSEFPQSTCAYDGDTGELNNAVVGICSIQLNEASNE